MALPATDIESHAAAYMRFNVVTKSAPLMVSSS